MSTERRLLKEGDHCPRCGTLFLFNNRTCAGVCDNCDLATIESARMGLARKYGMPKHLRDSLNARLPHKEKDEQR